jgi:hypothetical protein
MITQSVNTVVGLVKGVLADKIDDISAHYLAATIIEALRPEEQMIVPMLYDRVDVGTKIIRGNATTTNNSVFVGEIGSASDTASTVEKRVGRDWLVTYSDEQDSQTMKIIYGCTTVEEAVKEASLDIGNYEILSVVRLACLP